ncbi:MAG TPA: helix-turn-helix domain-containing protein [Solirubrobacteraceae bacterium]|nr:helix-turn-helix domain-containing protein [Solirubrobacteraceae bacterium]
MHVNPQAPAVVPAAEEAPSARPRTKAGQSEATTAALIRAGRELFAERGYADVATEEIVARAGVTRGALYHHFKGGKEELFHAVVVEINAETVRHVSEVARAQTDPWDQLAAGADAFLDAFAAPEVQRIVLVDAPSVLGWDIWRAIDSEQGLGLVEAAIQRTIDAGRLMPQPAKPLAHVVLGALNEAAMVVAGADDPAAARAEMSATVRRLLEGLRAPEV